MDPCEPQVGQLREDLDEDSLWQIRGKYGILDIDRYFLTVTDQ